MISWLAVIVQIGIGTQVREAVDLLNKDGIPRAEWADTLPIIFVWHKALSWLVSALVLTWFVLAWRKKVAGPVAMICVALLAVQAISGYLLVLTGFAAILQPVHLVAAMLLAGLLWWSLIRGPGKTGVTRLPNDQPAGRRQTEVTA